MSQACGWLSGEKETARQQMTGAAGALPYFIEFMKDFLKDKPKEDFPKAPTMPEDMKEMYKQRQRELALERAQMTADEEQTKTDENTPPAQSPSRGWKTKRCPRPRRKDRQSRAQILRLRRGRACRSGRNSGQTRPREAEPAKRRGRRATTDRRDRLSDKLPFVVYPTQRTKNKHEHSNNQSSRSHCRDDRPDAR